ncbi:hypothetical protein GCM10010168_42530 [Actinoplanes ianthinogenes]|uniref:Hemolysin type calcium-binding protein n=1 Tax=Actinoplanes ianthinogenes TaxID=122358 RepID=A0ABM7LVY8_9ACTN|nr:calcium-binding protein [Actinoplanes ianthinogenes]BCJ43437.1 hypothetical protein Aiant_40940 [Actinoplanes ianthinogenes]GGR20120.1 hypothetical protein GCM10010168_42530 [Actinoplanes ianthinogenes]
MRIVSRLLVLGVTTTAVAAVFAAPAQAASTGVASVSGSKVRFKAAATGANRVVITRNGRTITIDDKRAIKAGKGCKQVKGDKTKVRCTPATAPTRIRVELRGGNDVLDNRTGVRMTAYGNDGNDRIYGGSGDDLIYGGRGGDEIYGRDGGDHIYGASGYDVISGGAGNDQLFGQLGRDLLDGGYGDDQLRGDDPAQGAVAADFLYGGPGRDLVSYIQYRKAVTVNLDGRSGDGQAGERDTVGADVEDLEGGSGNDLLTGNAANNFLRGWSGDDVLRGGAGNDVLEDGLGRDSLYGEDGDDDLRGLDNLGTPSPDRIDGGANTDFCLYTPVDTLISCEESSTE